MKLMKYIAALLGSLCVMGGCNGIQSAEVYTVSVEPYRPVSDEDIRFGECSISFGDEVNVSGQGAWYKGSDIVISEGGIYNISGTYDGGSIVVDTPNNVKIVFSDANISSPNGCAIISSAEKLIIASEGSNTITSGNSDFAVYSDGGLLILGNGKMSINGGVFSRGGIRFGRSVSTLCQIIYTDDGELIPETLYIN